MAANSGWQNGGRMAVEGLYGLWTVRSGCDQIRAKEQAYVGLGKTAVKGR